MGPYLSRIPFLPSFSRINKIYWASRYSKSTGWTMRMALKSQGLAIYESDNSPTSLARDLPRKLKHAVSIP
jgi:hypothetical protein